MFAYMTNGKECMRGKPFGLEGGLMGKRKTRIFVKFVAAFCAIGIAISSSVFADTLGSWAIPASSIVTSLTSSVNAAGATVSPLGFTGTVTTSSAGWGGTGFSASTTIGAIVSKNFNFNITANAGYQIIVNGVSNFSLISSPSGPSTWTLFYSSTADFASPTQIASITGAGNTTKNITTDLTTALQANPITVSSGTTAFFRLVGTASGSTSGTGRIPSNTTISVLGTVGTIQLADLIWNGGSSGSWNYDNSNLVWFNGLNSVAFSSGAIATINSASSLTVDAGGVLAGAFTNNISSGTTVISGGALSSGAILNIGAGKLSLQSSNNAAKLQNSGSGTLSLAAPGTYTTVNLTAGKIETLANGVLSGAVNASGDSSLDVGTFSNTIGALTVNESSIVGTGILKGAGFGFALDQNDRTVAVSMQGTGGLSKTGSKTLTLSGSNSFSGDITLSGGTLATSGADRLPDTATVTMSANTILRLGGNETIKTLSVATTANNSAQVNLQSYQLTLNVTSSNAFIASMIGNGSFVKNGSSILTINELNTFSGGTTLNAGFLRLQASGNRTTNSDGTVTLASSPFGVGTLTLAGGSIYSSSTGSRNIYNNADIRGSFAFGDGTNASGTITVSTNVTGANTRLLADSTFTANTDTDWEQPILGSGFHLSKGGTNKLTLRSTNALGTLSVLAGILDARGSNSIGQVNVAGGGALSYAETSTSFGAATINLSNGAIFGQSASIGNTLSDRTLPNPIKVLGNVSFGIGAYTGSGGLASYLSGNVDLGGANQALTIANSTYFYGAVTNGGLVVNRLNTDLESTKTISLYGANSYSGGTTVNGSASYTNNPTLQLGNDSALGGGDLTLAGGGSLIVKAVSKADDIYNASRIITNNISIASGVSGVFDAGANSVTSLDGLLTSIVTNNMTLTGVISGEGSLVKTNSGNLTLSGTLSYTNGTTTVAGGNLVVVKSNLTATVSSNTVGIYFSNNVLAGPYAVLPGALNGTYFPATYENLALGQSAAFNQSTGQVVVTGNPISKTTPTVSVAPTASAVTVGALLSSSILSGGTATVAGATVAGTFAWTTPSTVVNATASYPVTFTPTDGANYNTATTSVSVTANPAGSTFEDAYPGKIMTDFAPNGLTWLANYAFGGNATTQATLPVQDTSDPTQLRLNVVFRTDDSTLPLTALGGEATTDLAGGWSASGVSVGDSTDLSPVPANTVRKVISVDVVSSDSRRFLRATITK